MGIFEGWITGGLLAGGGAGILTLIALFIRRVMADTSRKVAASDTEIKEHAINQSVLNMWNQEMTRMTKLNDELSRKLNEFQLENISLRSELATVSAQLEVFKVNNAQLHLELTNLQNLIKDLAKNCKGCIHSSEIQSIG